jgi:hypothetical protein
MTVAEAYSFETKTWTEEQPCYPGLVYPRLLADPEGGVILVGGYTAYAGNSLDLNKMPCPVKYKLWSY